MGQEIEQERFSAHDFAAFARRLEEETALLDRQLRDGRFDGGAWRAGFELEAWLVDTDLRPAPVIEPLLASLADPLVVHELARYNVELNGPPQLLTGTGLRQLHENLARIWTVCEAAAEPLGVSLAMAGIWPGAREEDPCLANMSEQRRFHALNEQHARLRGDLPIRLDIRGRERFVADHVGLMIESMATSFQIHLQVDARDGVRFYNAAQIATAPLVAVAANSPYLFGHDLWDETRIPLFEQALAVGAGGGAQRVTFGDDYCHASLLELFEANRDRFPPMLPTHIDQPAEALPHLRLHNGTIWRWNRVLIGSNETPHLRIEHRAVPAGPTVADCIANAAFFYGLVHSLARAEEPPEKRLPFAAAQANFYRAARFGLAAGIEWPGMGRCEAPRLLAALLPRAAEGLAAFGVDQGDIDAYLGIVEGRLRHGQNGAGWQRAWVARHGRSMPDLAAAYLERQRSGRPVHEWEL